MNIENTRVVYKRHENVHSYEANHSTAESGFQVKMQTLEKNICDKVTSEVENVVATVETRVYEAILSAMDNFVVRRMELAMRSIGIFSARIASSVVLDPNQRDFSGDTNGFE